MNATPEQSLWSDPVVSRWLHLNPDARKLAPHIDSYVEMIERHTEALENRNGIRIQNDYEYRAQLQELKNQLIVDSDSWSKRREVELILADYIATIPDPYNEHGLAEVVDKLRTCRQSGCIGIRPGGGSLIAWDNKCGMVRLCPDESREETQRLAERYVPAIRDWIAEKPGRRVFYAVLTEHNYRPGQLQPGKKYQFKKYKEFIDFTWKACPVDFYQEHGSWKVRRSRKRTMQPDTLRSIKGSLVVQEDPLSAQADWNIHLNSLLLVDGSFSFKEFRELWGANVELRQVDPDDLTRSILELVKYSAQAVSTKSDEKKKRHATDAPAMVEWKHDAWLEWWNAQQGFRRTRSYGCLYGIPALDKDDFNLSDVDWIGQVKFSLEGGYSVDLIPGDNFSNLPNHNDKYIDYLDPGGGGYG